MTTISLETLISNATAQLSVACLFCYWLLNWLEPRKLARFPRLIVTVAAVALFTRSVVSTKVGTYKLLWASCAALALIAAIYTITQWTKTSPVELFDEERQKNLGKGKNAGQLATSWTTGSKLAFVVWALALTAMLYIRYPEYAVLTALPRVLAAVQLSSIALMLGVAIFLCIELTFLSTPDALSVKNSIRVAWTSTARVAMAIASLALLCCLMQFLSKSAPTDLDASQRTVQIAAKAFGLVLLLATFTVWIVPRRLATFQESGKIPSDWISLTLTAWLGMFAFIVAATLPADWPWRLLGK